MTTNNNAYMRGQGMRASASRHSWMAFALARRFVALSIHRAADVAAAILAAEQIAAIQIERAIFALFAGASLHRWLARTLTGLGVACVQRANRSIDETVALCKSN